MKTIVAPGIKIGNFWNLPEHRTGKIFRLMRYVFRVNYKDNVILHNIVTGHLIKLDHDESGIIDNDRLLYTQILDPLIDYHFLVEDDCNEYQIVTGLRNLLRKLDDARQQKGINSYTILPTTACNARCYYCFEKGIKPLTMTENVADDVAEYIRTHCGEKKEVFITWFGGEPTVAPDRIDQICRNLQKNQIKYQSRIITNGYLFDEKMAERAKMLWNLTSAQISVDGTEKTYNRIKSYVNATDSPYKRVVSNLNHLIGQGIYVDLRMNYSKDTYMEFGDLVEYIHTRYSNTPLIGVRAHQINNGTEQDEEWFDEQNSRLNELSDKKGLFRKSIELPRLDYRWCDAARGDRLTILPDGRFVSCPEMLGENQIIGNVKDGIIDFNLAGSWRRFAVLDRCKRCEFYPLCALIAKCPGTVHCVSKNEHRRRCEKSIFQYIDKNSKAVDF